MLLHPSQGKFSDRLFVCIRHRPAEVKWRLGRSGEVFSLRRLVEAKPGSVRPGLHPLELAWIRAGSLEFPQKQFEPKSVFNGCRWSLVRPYVKAGLVRMEVGAQGFVRSTGGAGRGARVARSIAQTWGQVTAVESMWRSSCLISCSPRAAARCLAK